MGGGEVGRVVEKQYGWWRSRTGDRSAQQLWNFCFFSGILKVRKECESCRENRKQDPAMTGEV